jgi:hypothetical protein
MIMRNNRDSGNAQQHWWDDLPLPVRQRFRLRIQEELLGQTKEQRQTAAQSLDAPPSPSRAAPHRRPLLWDLLQLLISLLLVTVIILFLLLGGIIFVFSGYNPTSWPF